MRSLKPAPVVWFEVCARDAEPAMRFYEELFGWTFVPHTSEADPRQMWTIDTGQAPFGGTLVVSAEPPSAGTVLYVQVHDVEAAIARATELGAVLLRPARAIGGGAGTRAHIRGPDDHVIGLWSP